MLLNDVHSEGGENVRAHSDTLQLEKARRRKMEREHSLLSQEAGQQKEETKPRLTRGAQKRGVVLKQMLQDSCKNHQTCF